MSELEQYYRILDLEPGATFEEVTQAYKDLAFVWHPDRLPKDNTRLQEKAQKKLQEINEAREKLRLLKMRYQTLQYSAASTQKKPTQKSYQPPHPNPDLSGKDFSRANLQGKDLSGRNLSHANLSGANLSDAFMHKVNLKGANLSEANLFRANLLLADLREANLRCANLIGADLSGADLRGANFMGARMKSGDRLLVKLVGANLAGAIMPDGKIYE
ncbi:pentapeptide repeat-containing protein [Brasilonema sp. UFV-L1]|uniref:pentapeptide repeat-containing protein n=1 Tax=Brasilonema sp. UFV-L1 TaxID=2234130 RepID=UPI00145D4D3A|nr:pentapeptide repeat-containing protein [Brasilonema sp. UFV-L1]NMG11174.1 molecular chaperone DnaJ [Brasilonema sp. UFV-L1]